MGLFFAGDEEHFVPGLRKAGFPRYKEVLEGSWKEFFFVEEGDPTPVERIEADTEKEAEIDGIYDLNGTKKQSMQRGLNIIRMSDGTTKKVMVK